MKTRSTVGEVATGTLLLVLLAGYVALVAPKPKFLDSRSREADKSADISAEVERRVAESTAANEKKNAVVSASLNQMGVAAGQLPESPQKSFLVREGVWLSPMLPPPDPEALLASERRRVALLEGKLELADKLYAEANKDRAALLARTARAEARAEAAFSARRDMDSQLQQSAAYQRGQQAVIGILLALALLAAAGWIYARVTSLPKIDIARMANRARENGGNIVDAIDAVVPDAWHAGISEIAAKLRAKAEAKRAARKAAAEA